MDKKIKEIDAEVRKINREIQRLNEKKDQLLRDKEDMKNEARKHEKERLKETLLTKEFPWSSRIEDLLKNVFQLNQFRFNQREIINCILSRQNCFVIMPTGGGKSLCYQLSAIMRAGFSLVITPLISLMHDQCHELTKVGISCAMINSDTPKPLYNQIIDSMKEPPSSLDMKSREKLIFVSPEKLVKSKKLLSVLEHCYKVGSLDHIIVDEAHCCSEWGHDFRPDYKKLAVCKVLFPDTPIVALTATASPKVQQDVEEILQIPQCVTFSSSVNRGNLFYSVKPKGDTATIVNAQIVEFIEEINESLLESENPIGIIYCLSKKETEEIANYLKSKGYLAMPYHASLHPKDRDRVHQHWRTEKVHIIVATIAFGLGINKPNVRFVLHHTISKSLESYYQESGRAGRDGNFAMCCALYRPTDLGKLSSMVYYQHNAIEKLFDMVRYAASMTLCRKLSILHHFGESKQEKQTICCDNCSRDNETNSKENLTSCIESLQSLLQFLEKSDQKVTLLKLVQLWKGLARKSSHIPKEIPVAPRELTLYNCEEIIADLLLNGFLELQFHNTAYSTICYIKASNDFKNMKDYELQTKFDYEISFSTPKTPKKRTRSKASDSTEKKVKIPKLFPKSEVHSGISNPTPIPSSTNKKKEKSEPICIDLS